MQSQVVVLSPPQIVSHAKFLRVNTLITLVIWVMALYNE